jgi:hypothetical protein
MLLSSLDLIEIGVKIGEKNRILAFQQYGKEKMMKINLDELKLSDLSMV